MTMRIDGLSPQPKLTPAEQRNAPARSRKEGARATDQVEITRGAPDVSELAAQAKAAAADANPRLGEIRERVQSGYYDSREVREQVADSLLGSDSMREAVSHALHARVAKRAMADVPDVRQDRVVEARERAGSGFYDTQQTRQETADRILDELA